ncbi:hypothetical protein FRB99_003551, partial [Tulasnella sp. 403]
MSVPSFETTHLLNLCPRSNDDIATYKDASTMNIAENILSITTKWVAEVKRRRNRATPIYRLPSEILLIIFRLCVPSNDFQLSNNQEVD